MNVRRLDHWNGLGVDIEANREFFETQRVADPHLAQRSWNALSCVEDLWRREHLCTAPPGARL